MTDQNPPGYRRDVLPQHIEPFQAAAQAEARPDFERAWPHPFLVYTRSKLWDKAFLVADVTEGSETQVARFELYEGGMSFLHPVRKLQSDARHPGIVLGRAKNQDLVVPVASVSSAHAAFIPPQPGSTSWTVTDLGSKNGTWLEEEQLPGREPRAIADGQYLRLGGNLLAWFFSPGRLWELLRSPPELRKYTEL